VRLALARGLATVLLLASASAVLACECLPLSLETRYCQSSAVFVGTVIGSPRRDRDHVVAGLRVVEAWKAARVADTVTVILPAPWRSSCGLDVNGSDEPYLVFASPIPGESRLGANICSATPVGHVRAELDTLRSWKNSNVPQGIGSTLTIEVHDSQSGLPVRDARCFLLGRLSAATDTVGRVVIGCVPRGRLVMNTAARGYALAMDTVVVTGSMDAAVVKLRRLPPHSE
jgi:hypothetical protein